jgi:hypothetical protein
MVTFYVKKVGMSFIELRGQYMCLYHSFAVKCEQNNKILTTDDEQVDNGQTEMAIHTKNYDSL